MKFNRSALVLALAGALVAPAVLAGNAEDRAALARQLLDRWGNHVEEVHHQPSDKWEGEMAPLLKAVPLADLRRAAEAKNFDAMNDALLGKTSASGEGGSTQAFGDIGTDLVYVPITPCRIIDTRVAGGAIAANTVRNFDVTAVANYSFQGGDASNCGGAGAAGSFAAAVVNFTVVSPSIAGYITAYPYLATQPLAATVNYTAGDIRGNLAVVRLDQGASADELSVYTFAQTHLVADLVGYYHNPAAAVFECVTTAETIDSVPAGATQNTNAPSCPATYTASATNCEASSWQMPLVYQSDGTCSAQNNSAGTAQLRASRSCCRVRFP